MVNKSIAIDGPSGAGKSTLARMTAKKLDYIYVDTGAIYRSVGLYTRRSGVCPTDAESVEALLPQINIEMKYNENGEQEMYLNGECVSGLIRTPEASKYASDVSAIPAVRAFLLDMQREMAEKYNVIMDGRDIGTVVLPEAGVKVFLTASPEIRAKRRFIELKEKMPDVSYDDILKDMIQRDKNDSSRAAAPLKAADDAIMLDTSDMTLEESIDKLTEIVKERLKV